MFRYVLILKHAIYLDGTVFSWGRNDYGQLGRSSTKSQNGISAEERLQCVEHIPKIVQLSVGSEHNIALTGKLLDKQKHVFIKRIKDVCQIIIILYN